MAKYLINAKYTLDGVQGLLKEGGSSRRAAVEKSVAALGGKVECFYYSFGKQDVVIITDLPDHASAAALSLTVSAGGGVSAMTQVLLTTDEIDAATRKSVEYRPPGR